MTARTCVFTIAAKNYMHFVHTLFDSVRAYLPEADRVLALCDEPDGFEAPQADFKVLGLSDLPLPGKDRFIFQYTLLEISTAIKPFVIEHLMTKLGYDRVIYFDPDIRVYHSLAEMQRLLDAHAVLLTPHLTAPIFDDKRPSELEILKTGSYNLGFLGLRRTPHAEHLLKWWQDHLAAECVVDFERGLFVDQKWMELAPSLFENVYINRDPTWNVAYWNLHSRRVERGEKGYTVNGKPLKFYHFSGFDPASDVFSKHQDRFTMQSVPGALRELLADYTAELKRHGYPGNKAKRYAYAAFPDGTLIPDAARKVYRENRKDIGERFKDMHRAGAAAFQKWLNEPARVEGRSSPLVTRLAYAVYHAPIDVGLKRQFPDVLGVHARGFAEWFVANSGQLAGIPEYFIAPVRSALALSGVEGQRPASKSRGAILKAIYQFAWRWKDLTHYFLPLEVRQKIHGMLFKHAYAKAAPPPVSTVSGPGKVDPQLPKGLNIIGYLHAELGVGEAARSALRAARAAGIPVSTVDYRKGAVSRMMEEIDPSISRGQKYSVNLLHVNADQVPFAVAEFDHDFFAGHYNIGFWHWELPDFPDEWIESFQFLDEVWTTSMFCQESISYKSHKPVTKIGNSIEMVVPENIGRAELGLPEGFLFLFMFDVLSVPERKNPFGLIEAFRRAQSSLPKNSRLVLKIINADEKVPEYREILKLSRDIPGLHLVPQYLKRPELNAMFNACDSYVSLHRSEGFGLTMAEAMYLGKPVIATGWSSNLDFMTPWNSMLVKHKVVTLDRNYGPYNKGNRWADADLDDAAACMVKVATDADLRRALGEAASRDIRTRFSPAAIGEIIKGRLKTLGQL
jgi:glycosyltransferase involved in cell wall biosynthesis